MTVDTRTPTGRRVTTEEDAPRGDRRVARPVPPRSRPPRPPLDRSPADESGVYALIVDDSAVDLPVSAPAPAPILVAVPAPVDPRVDPPVGVPVDASGIYALVVDDSAVDLPTAASSPRDESGVYALIVDDSAVELPVTPVPSTPMRPTPAPVDGSGTAPEDGPEVVPAHEHVAVDPRMRARWIAARRAEGRRRLRTLLGVGGLLLLLLLLVGLAYSPLFDVEEVTVTGVVPEQAAAVRAVAGVSRGDAVMRVDTDAVARRVETLPWVVHASVSRSLPDSVRIEVTQRQVVAWVGAGPGGSDAIVAELDPEGRVVSLGTQAPGVPLLWGLVGPHEVGARGAPALVAAARAAAALPPDLRHLSSTLTVTKGQAVLRVGDGPEVRLGAPEDLTAKGRTTLALLAALHRPVHYIDVRVPAAPVTG